MITETEALIIAKRAFKERGIEYEKIADRPQFLKSDKIPWGDYKGEVKDTYSIWCFEKEGIYPNNLSIVLDAETGGVLFLVSPTRYFI